MLRSYPHRSPFFRQDTHSFPQTFPQRFFVKSQEKCVFPPVFHSCPQAFPSFFLNPVDNPSFPQAQFCSYLRPNCFAFVIVSPYPCRSAIKIPPFSTKNARAAPIGGAIPSYFNPMDHIPFAAPLPSYIYNKPNRIYKSTSFDFLTQK